MFTYQAPQSATTPPPAHPSVTGLSPASGPTGGGTSVTISGSNLSGATGVSFGSTAATINSDSSTSITVTSPEGSGTVNITVTTPGGSVGAGQFTYVVPAPTVSRYTPSTSAGCGTTTVYIYGSNLSGASVSFGGTDGSVTSDNGSQIVVTAPAPPANLGTVTITVTTPGGTATVGPFTWESCIQ
jgi:IPT/TIG domain